jgi:G3E family GTPase
MKPLSILQNIPCTLVTGFLGSGKTTIINQLLSSKPIDERWALLINEFGRIGIDGALLASVQDQSNTKNAITISEVSGGCICCTSQLPLQIALTRLLTEHRPQRLIIEPTGLAHPRELLRQLDVPHWRTALSMQAVISVLNALQWQQEKYRTHDGFQAHIIASDVLVINRYELLDKADVIALKEWISTLNTHTQIIWAKPMAQCETDDTDSNIINANDVTDFDYYSSELTAQLKKPNITISAQCNTDQNQALVNSAMSNSSTVQTAINDINSSNDQLIDPKLPYHYYDQQQDRLVGGWRLPTQRIFDFNNLKLWLLQLPDWQRIKGVINTTEGWLQINFTPDSLTTTNTSTQMDSRLEIILNYHDSLAQDKAKQQETWDTWNSQLMALII